MNPQLTLKALYAFTLDNYDELKEDYNKMSKKEKSALPFTLFIIGVFANLIKESQNDKPKEVI